MTDFGKSKFCIEEEAAIQRILRRKLGPSFIAQRSAVDGQRIGFLEGWKVINLANSIFGFNGWSYSIINSTIDFVDHYNSRYYVGVCTTVRVQLRDGTFREEIGYGKSEGMMSKAHSIEKARKDASSDGLKRAMKLLGNVLGNCLSDKEYLKAVTSDFSDTTEKPELFDLVDNDVELETQRNQLMKPTFPEDVAVQNAEMEGFRRAIKLFRNALGNCLDDQTHYSNTIISDTMSPDDAQIDKNLINDDLNRQSQGLTVSKHQSKHAKDESTSKPDLTSKMINDSCDGMELFPRLQDTPLSDVECDSQSSVGTVSSTSITYFRQVDDNFGIEIPSGNDEDDVREFDMPSENDENDVTEFEMPSENDENDVIEFEMPSGNDTNCVTEVLNIVGNDITETVMEKLKTDCNEIAGSVRGGSNGSNTNGSNILSVAQCPMECESSVSGSESKCSQEHLSSAKVSLTNMGVSTVIFTLHEDNVATVSKQVCDVNNSMTLSQLSFKDGESHGNKKSGQRDTRSTTKLRSGSPVDFLGFTENDSIGLSAKISLDIINITKNMTDTEIKENISKVVPKKQGHENSVSENGTSDLEKNTNIPVIANLIETHRINACSWNSKTLPLQNDIIGEDDPSFWDYMMTSQLSEAKHEEAEMQKFAQCLGLNRSLTQDRYSSQKSSFGPVGVGVSMCDPSRGLNQSLGQLYARARMNPFAVSCLECHDRVRGQGGRLEGHNKAASRAPKKTKLHKPTAVKAIKPFYADRLQNSSGITSSRSRNLETDKRKKRKLLESEV